MTDEKRHKWFRPSRKIIIITQFENIQNEKTSYTRYLRGAPR